MQANYIVQKQKTNGVLTGSIPGFSRSTGNLVNSTFANMFAQMQTDGSGGYGKTEQTNAPASSPRSYDGQGVRQDSQDYAKETQSYDETNRTQSERSDQAVDAPNEEAYDAAVRDESTAPEAEDSDTDPKSRAVAELVGFLQNAAQQASEGTLDLSGLDEAARADLLKLFKVFQEGDAKNKATMTAEIKALLKDLPDLAKTLTDQASAASGGKGASLSALKEMAEQLSLKLQGMEYKKGVKEEGAEAKAAQSDFSMLESAASEHSKRKIKTDAAKDEAKDAGQNSAQSDAGRTQSERAMNAAADAASRNRQTQESGAAKRTLTGAEGRADATAQTERTGGNVRSDKAAKSGSDQSTVIKNFQEIRALLDKQLVQVREASPSTMTIKLNPDELGKISIQLELLEDGRLKGRIFAENEVTRSSLQQHTEAMKDQIKAQGVTLESFEVELGGEQANPDTRSFEQQGQFGRQTAKNRQNGYTDTAYHDETGEPLQAEQPPGSGMINTLA